MFKKVIASVFIFASITSAQPALATSHAKTLSNLGMDEIMFAQSMIPHHEQAIEMADIALDPTKVDAGLEIRLATGKREHRARNHHGHPANGLVHSRNPLSLNQAGR